MILKLFGNFEFSIAESYKILKSPKIVEMVVENEIRLIIVVGRPHICFSKSSSCLVHCPMYPFIMCTVFQVLIVERENLGEKFGFSGFDDLSKKSGENIWVFRF